MNFGTYPSIGEAKRVRALIVDLLRPGMTVWTVLEILKERGEVPPHVLPRWVYRIRDGSGFGAKVISGDFRGEHLPGPFNDAVTAYRSMKDHLRRKVRYGRVRALRPFLANDPILVR